MKDYPYIPGWRQNRENNKPAINHSVLMLSKYGVSEGEWNGNEWIQYRWSGKLKDFDVLYWIHLEDLTQLEKEGDSLQQEQPEYVYGRTLEEREKYCKFCSAICEARIEQEQPDKSKKDCNICPHCVDRKDQYGWHFKGCFGGPYNGKFIAEIDECPLKQEQQEVDLEKEIDKWLKAGPITDTRYSDYCDSDIQETARHFYELARQKYEK